MSATGLEVFDKTIQVTNIWLGEIMERLGPDRWARAYEAGRKTSIDALLKDIEAARG